MAPEVLPCGSGAGEYTLKADCWSLGVILYIILSGAMPFVKGREDGMSLHDQISNGSFIFYGHLFHKISQEALDLIKRLLTPNPEERLSIEDTLNHPWLQVLVFHAWQEKKNHINRKYIKSSPINV